jgi:hypothetical protein
MFSKTLSLKVVISVFCRDVNDILRSTGVWCNIKRWFCTDVSVQRIGTPLRGQEVLELLTLEERRSQGEVELREKQNNAQDFLFPMALR